MKHGRMKKCLAFVLAGIMCLSALVSVLPAAQAADSETLSGWTLDEGFSVTSIWVYEGSYALEHTYLPVIWMLPLKYAGHFPL